MLAGPLWAPRQGRGSHIDCPIMGELSLRRGLALDRGARGVAGAATPTDGDTSTATPDTDVVDWSGRVRLSTGLDLDATPVQPAGYDDIHLDGNTKATFKVST